MSPTQVYKIFAILCFLGVFKRFNFAEGHIIRFPMDDLNHHNLNTFPPSQTSEKANEGVGQRRQRRSFDLSGLIDYAMGTIYSLTTYPYPYPSLYGHGYGHRLLNPLLGKFGPGVGHRGYRYSYSPGSYSTYHATRGYGFH